MQSNGEIIVKGDGKRAMQKVHATGNYYFPGRAFIANIMIQTGSVAKGRSTITDKTMQLWFGKKLYFLELRGTVPCN